MPPFPSPLPTVTLETEAFCYGPLVDRLDPRDLASSERAQRWSDAGAPTVYLASDIGVALAEWGRHVPVRSDRDDSALWCVPVRLRRAVDLRPGRGFEAGSGPHRSDGFARRDQCWYMDQETTRDLAARLRYEDGLDGLVVPSVAFLDDPSRGNIVVFVDGEGSLAERLGEPRCIADVRWLVSGPADAALDTRLQVSSRPSLLRV